MSEPGMPAANEKVADIGHVYRSLERSRTRQLLYDILCEKYPRKMGVNELCAIAWVTRENALGALSGHKGRFAWEDSLVGMGLAAYEEEFVYGQFAQTYQATQHGLDLKDTLAEYGKQKRKH